MRVRTDPPATRIGTLLNFKLQAHGAEILRLAACLMTEAGLGVACPVHDAFVIVAPVDQIDADVARAREFMEEAGRIVLDGFRLRTDVKIVRWPERYADPRGQGMWDLVMKVLARSSDQTPGHHRQPGAEARPHRPDLPTDLTDLTT